MQEMTGTLSSIPPGNGSRLTKTTTSYSRLIALHQSFQAIAYLLCTLCLILKPGLQALPLTRKRSQDLMALVRCSRQPWPSGLVQKMTAALCSALPGNGSSATKTTSPYSRLAAFHQGFAGVAYVQGLLLSIGSVLDCWHQVGILPCQT